MLSGPFCSTEIQFIAKSELAPCLDQLVVARKTVLLANEDRIRDWGIYTDIEKYAGANHVLWIKKRYKNLTEKAILECLQEIEGSDISQIVAIGGGSILDLAKCLSALSGMDLQKPEEIIDAIINKTYCRKKDHPQIVAVPTTAGTGSEVTRWATVWRSDSEGKLSVECAGAQPSYAYIVPELMRTLPIKPTLTTGLDAFAQAAEAYWSRNSSFLVQDLSLRAIQVIMHSLPSLLKKMDDMELRTNMCRGSLLAGLAFSKTRTTACHSISYYLTQRYGIDHGLAVAMTLDAVWRRNQSSMQNAAELERLFEQYGGLKPWLVSVTHGIVELSLHQNGVGRDEINDIAEHSVVQGRMDNNPIQFTIEEVREILMECW